MAYRTAQSLRAASLVVMIFLGTTGAQAAAGSRLDLVPIMIQLLVTAGGFLVIWGGLKAKMEQHGSDLKALPYIQRDITLLKTRQETLLQLTADHRSALENRVTADHAKALNSRLDDQGAAMQGSIDRVSRRVTEMVRDLSARVDRLDEKVVDGFKEQNTLRHDRMNEVTDMLNRTEMKVHADLDKLWTQVNAALRREADR